MQDNRKKINVLEDTVLAAKVEPTYFFIMKL